MAGFKGYKRSIILDFDYKSVSKGVPDVNRQMALLNAEYRKVEAEINKTGSASDKLKLSQEKLTNAVKLQGDKVTILKRELEELSKSEGKNEKAIDRKKIALANAETQLGKTNEQLIKVSKELNEQNEGLGKVNSKWKDFISDMREANPEFDNAVSSLAKTSAVITGVGVASAKSSMDFDKAFSQVAVLADETQVPIGQLRKEVLRLSRELNIKPTALAQGLGEIHSSNVQTANSVEMLTDAGKLARTGNAELDASIKVLTGTINAYGLEVKDSTSLADKLFKAQELGSLKLNELGDGFGRVGALAATANIPIDEVLAALVTLTVSGMGTSEAITTLNATLTNVVKPSKSVTDSAKEMGVNFSLASLQSKGLAGFLADVTRRAKGNDEAMINLFGSSKAVTGVLALTKVNADHFAKSLEAISNAGGEVDQAFDKISDRAGEQWSSAMNELKVSLIEIGTAINPLISALATMAKWLGKIPAEGWIVIAMGMAAHKTLNLISMALPILAAKSTLASGALTALGVSTGFSGSQMFVAAAAIGIVVGLIALLVGRTKSAKEEMNSLAKSTQRMVDGAMSNAQNAVNQTQKRAYAIGTNYASGGVARVGEHGPEDVILPRGSKVVTSSTTRAQDSAREQEQAQANRELGDKIDRLTSVVMGIKQEVYNMPQRQQSLSRMGTARG